MPRSKSSTEATVEATVRPIPKASSLRRLINSIRHNWRSRRAWCLLVVLMAGSVIGSLGAVGYAYFTTHPNLV